MNLDGLEIYAAEAVPDLLKAVKPPPSPQGENVGGRLQQGPGRPAAMQGSVHRWTDGNMYQKRRHGYWIPLRTGLRPIPYAEWGAHSDPVNGEDVAAMLGEGGGHAIRYGKDAAQSRHEKALMTAQAGDLDAVMFFALNSAEVQRRAREYAEAMDIEPSEVEDLMKAQDAVLSVLVARGDLLYTPDKWGRLTAVKDNSDAHYVFTLDLDACCPKRRDFLPTVVELQRRLKTMGQGVLLDDSDLFDLAMFMDEKGETHPCLYCYVDNKRFRYYENVIKAVESHNFDHPDNQLDWALFFDPIKYEQAVSGRLPGADPEAVKAVVRKSTVIQKTEMAYTPYMNDLLAIAKKRPGFMEVLNSHAGLRMFSNTDFKPEHTLDLMVALFDAGMLGLGAHAYTKQPDFVRVFGDTGIKINMSVAANERGGGYAEDAGSGMPWKDAVELKRKHPNAGVMFMAKNRRQVAWALKQNWIDMVIPFHDSQMPPEHYEALGYDNFTAHQLGAWKVEPYELDEPKIKKVFPGSKVTLLDSRTAKSKHAGEYLVRAWRVETPDGRKFVMQSNLEIPISGQTVVKRVPMIVDGMHQGSFEEYSRICRALGVHVKFSGFDRHGTYDASFDFTKGAKEDPRAANNYMKLITETSRRVPPQGPVDPSRINVGEAKRIIKRWQRGGGSEGRVNELLLREFMAKKKGRWNQLAMAGSLKKGFDEYGISLSDLLGLDELLPDLMKSQGEKSSFEDVDAAPKPEKPSDAFAGCFKDGTLESELPKVWEKAMRRLKALAVEGDVPAERIEEAGDPEKVMEKSDRERLDYRTVNSALLSDRPSEKFREWLGDGTLERDLPCLAALVGVKQDHKWHPEGDVWTHTMKAVDAYEGDVVGRWATLFHDTGKKTTHRVSGGHNSFPEHAKESAKFAAKAMGRLGVPEELRKRVLWLVKVHDDYHKFTDYDLDKIKELTSHPDFGLYVRLAYADVGSRGIKPVAWDEGVRRLKGLVALDKLPKAVVKDADAVRMVKDFFELSKDVSEKDLAKANKYHVRRSGPAIVFHGTEHFFKFFHTGHGGSATGAKDGILGLYFTDNPYIAQSFGDRIFSAKIEMDKPLVFARSFRMKDGKREFEGDDPYDKMRAEIVAYVKGYKPYAENYHGDVERADVMRWKLHLVKQGHDGIILRDTGMNADPEFAWSESEPWHDMYIPFHASQVLGAHDLQPLGKSDESREPWQVPRSEYVQPHEERVNTARTALDNYRSNYLGQTPYPVKGTPMEQWEHSTTMSSRSSLMPHEPAYKGLQRNLNVASAAKNKAEKQHQLSVRGALAAGHIDSHPDYPHMSKPRKLGKADEPGSFAPPPPATPAAPKSRKPKAFDSNKLSLAADQVAPPTEWGPEYRGQQRARADYSRNTSPGSLKGMISPEGRVYGGPGMEHNEIAHNLVSDHKRLGIKLPESEAAKHGITSPDEHPAPGHLLLHNGWTRFDASDDGIALEHYHPEADAVARGVLERGGHPFEDVYVDHYPNGESEKRESWSGPLEHYIRHGRTRVDPMAEFRKGFEAVPPGPGGKFTHSSDIKQPTQLKPHQVGVGVSSWVSPKGEVFAHPSTDVHEQHAVNLVKQSPEMMADFKGALKAGKPYENFSHVLLKNNWARTGTIGGENPYVYAEVNGSPESHRVLRNFVGQTRYPFKQVAIDHVSPNGEYDPQGYIDRDRYVNRGLPAYRSPLDEFRRSDEGEALSAEGKDEDADREA